MGIALVPHIQDLFFERETAEDEPAVRPPLLFVRLAAQTLGNSAVGVTTIIMAATIGKRFLQLKSPLWWTRLIQRVAHCCGRQSPARSNSYDLNGPLMQLSGSNRTVASPAADAPPDSRAAQASSDAAGPETNADGGKPAARGSGRAGGDSPRLEGSVAAIHPSATVAQHHRLSDTLAHREASGSRAEEGEAASFGSDSSREGAEDEPAARRWRPPRPTVVDVDAYLLSSPNLEGHGTGSSHGRGSSDPSAQLQPFEQSMPAAEMVQLTSTSFLAKVVGVRVLLLAGIQFTLVYFLADQIFPASSPDSRLIRLLLFIQSVTPSANLSVIACQQVGQRTVAEALAMAIFLQQIAVSLLMLLSNTIALQVVYGNSK
jgi:hypothetical protein